MLVCPKCGSTYTREQEHCGLDGTKLVDSESDPLIGQVIDKYRIEERLGSGGMATVYRAHHQFLEKDYAVKVLHGQIAADSTMARRFQREAKTLGSIKHPNVVSVDNFGTTAAGLLYMVMEFVDGHTLGQALRASGPFAPARAADIVRQIATGLQAAHRKGFVHRDLKPGNVMLVADELEGETVKLLDFGLVRILTADDNQTQLTQEGQFFGTPMYMAPEQIMGDVVGPPVDLYALGVILYQMLAGKPPFTGDIKQLAFQHVQNAPPVLDSPYGGLSELSRELMAKVPQDRPVDAAAVISRIDELALTPISKRIHRAGIVLQSEQTEAPALELAIEHASDDDPALSRPILDEERAFRTAHEADAELLKQSINSALARKAPWRARVLWFVLLTVCGATGWLYVQNGGRLDVEAFRQQVGRASDVLSALDPNDDRAPRPSSGADPGPGSPRETPPPPGRQAPTLAKTPAVPPSPVKTPEEPPAPPASAPSDEPDGTEASEPPAPPPGPPRTFDELHLDLTRALSARGLLFQDLFEVEPDAADTWRNWREANDSPGRRRRERTYAVLERAAREMKLDGALLEQKLDRVDGDLRVLKALGATGRQAALSKRFKKLSEMTRSRQKKPEVLAAKLTRLEADVASAIEAARSGNFEVPTDNDGAEFGQPASPATPDKAGPANDITRLDEPAKEAAKDPPAPRKTDAPKTAPTGVVSTSTTGLK